MMKRASLLVTDFMLFVILVIADQLTKHLVNLVSDIVD